MTVTLPSNPDEVRYYQVHRWLSPFPRRRAQFVSGMTPEEIGRRIRTGLRQESRSVPMVAFRGLAGTLNHIFKPTFPMTVLEEGQRPEDGDSPEQNEYAWTDSLYGDVFLWGFFLARDESDPIRLRATYRVTPAGTQIDTTFGWSWTWTAMTTWNNLPKLASNLRFALLATLPGIVVGVPWLILLLVLVTPIVLDIVRLAAPYAIISWQHRDDFAVYHEFLVSVVDAREVS